MDLSDFVAGSTVKQPTGYKSFISEPINHTFTWKDPSINTLLERTTLQLVALNIPAICIKVMLHGLLSKTWSFHLHIRSVSL